VFFAVYVGVIFQGLEVSDNLGGHPEVDRRTFLQDGCEPMSLADRGQAREQQVDIDDLAVSGSSEAYAMVLNGELRANVKRWRTSLFTLEQGAP
jgi:hypothetical protein